MKANVGKKTAFQCNFVLSYLQKDQVLVGKVREHLDPLFAYCPSFECNRKVRVLR